MVTSMLTEHLKVRPLQLEEARSNGTKVVGYLPGNYVPEEIIYAAGAAFANEFLEKVRPAGPSPSQILEADFYPLAMRKLDQTTQILYGFVP